jgi:hypothetical protein
MSTEERIPASHPLRQLRLLADQPLDRLNPTFCDLYPILGAVDSPVAQVFGLLLHAICPFRS